MNMLGYFRVFIILGYVRFLSILWFAGGEGDGQWPVKASLVKVMASWNNRLKEEILSFQMRYVAVHASWFGIFGDFFSLKLQISEKN